jgi:hypothetical protein
MEKYVQYGFSPSQRDIIFGNDDSNGNKWNNLINFEDLYNSLKPNIKEEIQSNKVSEKNNLTIEELLKPDSKRFYEQNDSNGDTAERFNSVINFSNFLLHILRIQVNQDSSITDEKIKNVPLDDKRLLELFEPFLKKDERDPNKNKEFVLQFGYNLLKGKFYFDKYVIKREFAKGTDHWSLKRLKWNYGNKVKLFKHI